MSYSSCNGEAFTAPIDRFLPQRPGQHVAVRYGATGPSPVYDPACSAVHGRTHHSLATYPRCALGCSTRPRAAAAEGVSQQWLHNQVHAMVKAVASIDLHVSLSGGRTPMYHAVPRQCPPTPLCACTCARTHAHPCTHARTRTQHMQGGGMTMTARRASQQYRNCMSLARTVPDVCMLYSTSNGNDQSLSLQLPARPRRPPYHVGFCPRPANIFLRYIKPACNVGPFAAATARSSSLQQPTRYYRQRASLCRSYSIIITVQCSLLQRLRPAGKGGALRIRGCWHGLLLQRTASRQRGGRTDKRSKGRRRLLCTAPWRKRNGRCLGRRQQRQGAPTAP